MIANRSTAKSFWSCSSTFKVCGLFALYSTVYVCLYTVSLRPCTVKYLVQDTNTDLNKCRNGKQDIGIIDKTKPMRLSFSVTGRALVAKHTTTTATVSSRSQITTTTRTYKPIKTEKIKNESISLLILFTTWQSNKEKELCHNNTVENWLSLKPFVESIVFTNEKDLKERVIKKGWTSLPVRRSADGVPILKYMYLDATDTFKSKFYAYCNGDILFTNSLVSTLVAILNSTVVPHDEPMMIIGRRTNVKDVTKEEAASWKNIKAAVKSRGKLFATDAEDYFITLPIYPWKDIPEVVVGRHSYDNWLVLNARKQGHTTIDVSNTVLAVHQTTQSGNYEGNSHKNREYNRNILRRMYKTIHYRAGLTRCTQFYTNYDTKGNPVVVKRNINKSCPPI